MPVFKLRDSSHMQNSDVFVVANRMAPALRMLATQGASEVANTCRRNTLPAVFDMFLTKIDSLHVKGTPSKGMFSSLYETGTESDSSM
jgi:hypothetical protein